MASGDDDPVRQALIAHLARPEHWARFAVYTIRFRPAGPVLTEQGMLADRIWDECLRAGSLSRAAVRIAASMPAHCHRAWSPDLAGLALVCDGFAGRWRRRAVAVVDEGPVHRLEWDRSGRLCDSTAHSPVAARGMLRLLQVRGRWWRRYERAATVLGRTIASGNVR